MARIFISYSRDSQEIVEELVEDLIDDGHETWFDQRLTGGQQWWDAILGEIRNCDIFIAALTPDSLESQACHREMNYAERLKKPVLPVRLSSKVLPETLAHCLAKLQCVDYGRQDKFSLKRLQRTIREAPKAPPLPDPLPDPPPVPMSYLSTLREQIEIDSPLTLKDQSHLVFELKCHYRDGGRAEEVLELLQRLRRRDDFLAKVGRDIDELLDEINSTQLSSQSNNGSVPLPENISPPPASTHALRNLSERIQTKSPLAINDQFQLVFELRDCFRNGAPAEEITELLLRLKTRDEIPAKVSCEIGKLMADIKRTPGAGSGNGHLDSITLKEGLKDPIWAHGSEAEAGRVLKLENMGTECRRLMGRVHKNGEAWIFEIDPKNRFIVELDTSTPASRLTAKASLVDTIGGAKARELKALGWTIDSFTAVKSALAGAALYLTTGLAAAALLSRGVRDALTEIEANRSWAVTSPEDDALSDAAADLTLALRRVAATAETIIVKRQEVETHEAEMQA